jgi:hypothetical protein
MPGQEDINHQLKLLQTYRDNLRHALNQQAHFGALTPAMVINDIRDTRQNIRSIKATLKKWGVSFEDLEIDEEQSAPPAAAPTSAQASPVTTTPSARPSPARARYLETQREKRDAAYAELESADEVRKVGLWKQIERLEQEIAKLEREFQ